MPLIFSKIMNLKQQNRDSTFLNKAEHVILLLLFFSVSILPKVTTILIILYALFSLVNYKKIDLRNLWLQKSFLLLILIYFILIVGLIYTSDLSSGLRKIQTQISFLIFPLFLGTKIITKKNRNTYLFMFVLGVLVTVSVCFGYGLYRFFSNESMYVLDEFSKTNNIFLYVEFSKFLDLHPTYFSIYIAVSFFALIELPKSFFSDRPVLKRGIVLILLLALILTSSKGGIFSFVISGVVYTAYVYMNKKRKFVLKKILILCAGVMAVFFLNPMLYKRSEQLLVSFDKFWIRNEQLNESTSIRFGLWKLSTDVSKENMFFGHGTGSVYRTLNDNCIYLFSFSICESLRNKNCHNQYLNFLVSNGILILLPFLFVMVKSILNALRNRDVFLLFFIVFMGLNFMFESLLQRERGVVFFTMFLILLLASNKTKQSKCKNQRI